MAKPKIELASPLVYSLSEMNKMSKQQDEIPRIVVGANWITNPGRWWVPAGLERTHDLSSMYRPLSFGADRVYGAEEGWQTCTTRKQRQVIRRRHRMRSGPRDESYDFADE